MKKQLLFFFLLCCTISRAQQSVVFLPPGAVWHYNFDFYGFYSINTYPESASYIGDTLIAGETIKKLQHPQFYRNSCPSCTASITLIKQHQDTIFMKNSCITDWQVLYNFAVPAGGQWTVSTGNPANTVYTVSVNSTQTITINNTSLKQLNTTITSSNASGPGITFTQTMTERFGAAYFFYFGQGSCDGSDFKRFLCYQDNSFPLYQASTYPCNYTYVGIKENTKDAGVLIYPNPAGNSITVKTNNSVKFTKAVIMDVSGREIQHYNLQQANEPEINLSELQRGIYFLQLYTNEKLTASRKIIKE